MTILEIWTIGRESYCDLLHAECSITVGKGIVQTEFQVDGCLIFLKSLRIPRYGFTTNFVKFAQAV